MAPSIKDEAPPIRWRKGEFICCGAFRTVYMGINTDSGNYLLLSRFRFYEPIRGFTAVAQPEIMRNAEKDNHYASFVFDACRDAFRHLFSA